MPKPRVEISRLSRVASRRFGALLFRPLTRRAAGRLTVLHISMKPGAKAPALYHARTDEFFYVLKGGARGLIGRRRRSFRAGDFVFLPARTPHEFTAGPRGIELLDVFVPGFDLRRPDIVVCCAKTRKTSEPRNSP
jgi:mannose-6-phosphate isomerase-like protein (cupin superfamily)